MSSFDFFPKVEDGLSERTVSGALISVISFAFIVWAGMHELSNCMRIETHDRLVPHTSDEHANVLSINLDLHFPALPCSELVLEVRDQSGSEVLRSHNSVSKLRTTSAGTPIGMPQRLEFTERVALGIRLNRFMHVLGDTLVQLLRFSLRSGCKRNYTAVCPDRWEELRRGQCKAPLWYFGHCNHVSSFDGYTADDKEDWSLGCQANWPCLSHAIVDLDQLLGRRFNATGKNVATLERSAEIERAEEERMAGYEWLQANLTLVMREVEELSPEKEHRQRLTATLAQMNAHIQELKGGASGEPRHQLELSLEEEGTRLLTSLKVRIVPAMSESAELGGYLPCFQVKHALYFNVSHEVRHLSFGTYFPGMHNPLDNTSKHSADGAAEARYMIKVVPSSYTAINGTITLSNLFSVTEHFHPLHWHSGQNQLPGVYLAYEISGMKVSFTEQHGASLCGAVARICALVGGVMTVASVIDKIVYQSSHLLLKNRMGKLS